MLDKEVFYKKYNLPKDVRDWRYEWAKLDIEKSLLDANKVKKILYRPFDTRFIYYTGQSRGFVGWPVYKVMQHFIQKDNVGFITARSNKSNTCDHFFVSKHIMETKCGERTTQSAICPLYLYPDPQAQGGNQGQDDLFKPSFPTDEAKPQGKGNLISHKDSLSDCDAIVGNDEVVCERDEVACERNEIEKRTPNFDAKILKKFTKGLGLTFIPDHADDPDHGTLDKGAVNPLDILDYIYAVLHSPKYRETYKAFLKIDFPKIPYPTDIQKFWQLVALGREIRLYHLLEHPDLTQQNFTVTYPIAGDNIITTKIGQNDWQCLDAAHGRIMLNDTQYFDNIPVTAWEFYIGGYQPAQKWLKDRKGRTLSFDDIQHYQKMIHSLMQTHILMQKIDMI